MDRVSHTQLQVSEYSSGCRINTLRPDVYVCRPYVIRSRKSSVYFKIATFRDPACYIMTYYSVKKRCKLIITEITQSPTLILMTEGTITTIRLRIMSNLNGILDKSSLVQYK